MLQSLFETLVELKADTKLDAEPDSFFAEVRQRVTSLRAWRHPLGFAHIELTPLVRVAEGQRFRLHVWDNAGGTTDDLGDLHDHVWDLSSWVLRGALEDRTFQPVKRENGEYFGSRISYGERNAAAVASRFDLNERDVRLISAGNAYVIPHGTVHSSAPQFVPTVTVLASSEDPQAVARGPLVLSRSLPRAGVTARRHELPTTEIDELLARAQATSQQ